MSRPPHSPLEPPTRAKAMASLFSGRACQGRCTMLAGLCRGRPCAIACPCGLAPCCNTFWVLYVLRKKRATILPAAFILITMAYVESRGRGPVAARSFANRPPCHVRCSHRLSSRCGRRRIHSTAPFLQAPAAAVVTIWQAGSTPASSKASLASCTLPPGLLGHQCCAFYIIAQTLNEVPFYTICVCRVTACSA